jgi:hypothetical protein
MYMYHSLLHTHIRLAIGLLSAFLGQSKNFKHIPLAHVRFEACDRLSCDHDSYSTMHMFVDSLLQRYFTVGISCRLHGNRSSASANLLPLISLHHAQSLPLLRTRELVKLDRRPQLLYARLAVKSLIPREEEDLMHRPRPVNNSILRTTYSNTTHLNHPKHKIKEHGIVFNESPSPKLNMQFYS